MKILHKTCINCPIGCDLEIRVAEDGTFTVSGFNCPRGKKYAESEMTDPRRTVTATAATDSTEYPRLPVRSAEPIPKAAIPEVLKAIEQLTVKLPVRMGEVLLENAGGTGVKILASRTLPPGGRQSTLRKTDTVSKE